MLSVQLSSTTTTTISCYSCCGRKQARSSPPSLNRPFLVCSGHAKPPSCFLISHQQTSPTQENLWSWNKWPHEMTNQLIPQGNSWLWNTLPKVTTEKVSVQGPVCQRLQQPEWAQLESVQPYHSTIIFLIKGCTSTSDCNHVHAYIIKQGLDCDAFLGGTLIDAYAKCGSIEYACMVFHRLPQQDVVTWSALILAHALHSLCEGAFQLLSMMQLEGTEPNDITWVCLIKACSIARALNEGKQLHVYVADRGLDSQNFIGNSLTDMYIKCGSPENACLVFQKLQVHDVVAWNVVIGGHAQHGDGEEALRLSQQMQQSGIQPNEITLVSILQACANIAALRDGECAHKVVLENGLLSNVFVGNSLIHMYIECGSLDEACIVFLSLPFRDVVSWNALISGYSHYGCVQEVFQLFSEMRMSDVEPNNATFASTVQACNSRVWLEDGIRIHAQIVEAGYESCTDVSSSLISMYVRCESIEDVKALFYRLSQKSVLTWNRLLAALTEHGNVQEALLLFWQMQQEGLVLTEAASIGLSAACRNMEDSCLLMEVCAYVVESGLGVHTGVGSALIKSCCTSATLEDACLLFNRLHHHDAGSWLALIDGFVQEGHHHQAFNLIEQMLQEVVGVDSSMFVAILRMYSISGGLGYGMQIHNYIVNIGCETETSIGNALITMYVKGGCLASAHSVLDGLLMRDVVTWNSLMAGCIQHRDFEEVLILFQQMLEEGFEVDQVSLVCVLQACSNLAALDLGKGIHTLMVKCGLNFDILVSNTLMDMYAKCTSIEDVEFIFTGLLKRDTASWNVLIRVALQEGLVQEVFHMFNEMQKEDVDTNVITLTSLLQACSRVPDLKAAMEVHNMVIKKGYELDMFVGSSLIDVYGKCKRLSEAHIVFQSLPLKNTIVWNVLICGFVQNGDSQGAYKLFQQMQEAGVDATCATFLCILPEFSSLESLDEGRRVHAMIIENGMPEHVVNSLIEMYGRCWKLQDAGIVFNQCHNQDVLVWSALISCHFNNGHAKEALQLFKQMQHECISPDEVTSLLILKICSSLAALEHGRQIHSLMVEKGLELETSMVNTIMDMYANCGSLDDANIMFHKLQKRDVVGWSVMISGYAAHSEYALAVRSFENMQDDGLMPDSITYLSLLSACNNAGRVKEGSSLFKRMRDEHGLEPTPEHYNCIIDLLGGCGCIDEAQDLLDTLPYCTDVVAWTSLLGSCTTHRNLTVGQQCFDYLRSKEAAGYVFMSNLYAQSDMQTDSFSIEILRRCQKMWKKPGRASIEIGNHVHEFVVGDNSHPKTDEIYAKLKTLNVQSHGTHVPAQLSVSGEEKEDAICGHCETLAVSLGLLCLPQGATIRIAKNLRVCSDCHKAVKVISKMESREIVIKDTKCIHQFRDGICCCNGYG